MAKITCTKCSVEKNCDFFPTDRSRPSGKRHECKDCRRGYTSKYYATNREKILERTSKYNKENPEVVSKAQARYNKTDAGKKKTAEWKDNNRDLIRMYWQKRYAAKKNAYPSWMGEDERFFLKEIYELCELRNRVTGVKWEVDHVVPLQGKAVCGLHVPWNLQVITAKENRAKGNRFE